MAEQTPKELGSEVRRLERLIAENRRQGDMLRRTTAALVFGAVGLLVSLSVPWVMARPTEYTSEFSTSNTITRWADGWLLLGRSLSGGAKAGGSVVMVILILLIPTLAVLCVVLVLSPGPQAAMTATILGWLAAAVTGIIFILGFSGGSGFVSGSGLVMAAGSSVVVAIAANALRTALGSVPRPARPSLAELLPPIIVASAPRQDDAPDS